MSNSKEVYLVIGGSGFVGRHIVDALRARGDAVAVFDIVQRYHDVPFYTGDIAEEGSISTALEKVRPGGVYARAHPLSVHRAARRASSTPRRRRTASRTMLSTGA
jgi:sterol-4alpha-carboxylate 3-dehydrogenase (decarboxylating)